MTKTFSVTDYKGVRQITLSPSGSLVVIAGANGAGKTSFIDAIAELFDPKGTKLTPKPIREGAEEARAEYTDEDLGIRVARTWKKDDAGKLEVWSLDGAKYQKPTDLVVSLLGGAVFDPVSWLNLPEKAQREELLTKVELPFDLDALAREKAGAEERRLEAGREVRRLQGALSSLENPLDAPDVEVSAQDILDEIERAQDAQRHRERVERDYQDAAGEVHDLETQIAELQKRLTAVQERKAALYRTREALPEPVDLEPLRGKLADVDQINRAVRAKAEYRKVADEHAAAETAHAAAQRELDQIEQRKAEGLAQATFPVPGLSVSEDGVTFDGVPFSQVNSAHRMRVAFAVATAGDPKLKLVIVRNGDLLDADSLQALADMAEARGYTALVERDRDESQRIGFTIVDGALSDGASS